MAEPGRNTVSYQLYGHKKNVLARHRVGVSRAYHFLKRERRRAPHSPFVHVLDIQDCAYLCTLVSGHPVDDAVAILDRFGRSSQHTPP